MTDGELYNLLKTIAETDNGEFRDEMRNLLDEIDKIPEHTAKAEKYLAFARENPDDPIAKIALLLGNFNLIRPMQTWNTERMRNVAGITIPLQDLILELDPDAEISVELDRILERNIIMTVTSGQYNEWGILSEQMPHFTKLLSGIDEISIYARNDEKFVMMFVFKGVREDA